MDNELTEADQLRALSYQAKAMDMVFDAILGPRTAPARVPPRKTLPTFTCGYSDSDGLLDFDITYTAEGEDIPARDYGEDGIDPGSAPTITVTEVYITGHLIPLKCFSRQFIDVVTEHCAEYHAENERDRDDREWDEE